MLHLDNHVKAFTVLAAQQLQAVFRKGKVKSSTHKESIPALDQPICLLNKHSFGCQEHEANCPQVLQALGFWAFHQNSVECTQGDSIHVGETRRKE